MLYSVETARLHLRPLLMGDAQALTDAIYGDPLVVQYLPSSDDPPLERSIKTIARYAEYWQSDGYGPWAVQQRDNGMFIGRGGLKPFPELGLPELIYAFMPLVWGQGFATELALASIRFAFETLKLSAVVAFIDPANFRSQRVLERIGMTSIGIQQTDYYTKAHAAYRLDVDAWQAPLNHAYSVYPHENNK